MNCYFHCHNHFNRRRPAYRTANFIIAVSIATTRIMPLRAGKPEHLYYKEVNAKDGAYYRRWASVFGEYTVRLIDTVLRFGKA